MYKNLPSFVIIDGDPIINHSNVRGGSFGNDNMNADPSFVNPALGDYSLQSDSPCINSGTDFFEYEGEIIVDIPESEYSGIAPDMGAFEFEGSSLTGDLNGDGMLNILDVVMLVNIVLGYGDPLPSGDLNGDGVLNILDVVALIYIILGG